MTLTAPPPNYDTTDHWFATIRDLTTQLVAVRGVSPSTSELQVAAKVMELLTADDLGSAYDRCELLPLPGDLFGRANALALLRGRTTKTVVLLGHIDTVGTSDFGALESAATNPDVLQLHLPELLGGAQLENPDEWLFGRGALDMKSGVAINIALMRHFAAHYKATGERPPFTLICLATPDEESQSCGAMAAMRWLAELRHQEQLRYIGLINTDFVTTRFPGDTAHMVYTGSVGKLLPCFYVVGEVAHAGAPFAGVDANLILAEIVQAMDMQLSLVDRAGNEKTAPPVMLHMADRKTSYNTQTALAAWGYLNVLTMRQTPRMVLRKLERYTNRALQRVLKKLARRYRRDLGDLKAPLPPHLVQGRVFNYADLHALVTAQSGPAEVQRVLHAASARCRAEVDLREATLYQIEALWQLSGLRGPAVVLALAPPFYPHTAPQRESSLVRAVRAVVARHAQDDVELGEYFPLLSDLSYVQMPGTDLTALKANMPLWSDEPREQDVPHYTVPFAAIRTAAVEGVVNIGPYGFDGHQRGERVHMPYSFVTVPNMILETIFELAAVEQ